MLKKLNNIHETPGVCSLTEAQSFPATASGVSFFLILFLLLKTPLSFALEVDLNAISMIESSNNPEAVGDHGAALGLFQLHSGIIGDYNHAHGTHYAHKAALSATISQEVADWYLNTRIPGVLKHYKIKDSLKNRIIAYNSGYRTLIKRTPLPKITKDYLIKYQSITKKRLL